MTPIPSVIPFPARTAAPSDKITAEMADLDLLHAISTELIGEQDRMELYGKIVDAAVSITGSQFGTIQLLCPKGDPSGHGGELQLLCSRGLSPEIVGFWQWVSPAAYSSCTQALKFGARAIIPDFETWADIAGTPDLEAFRRAGIRSAQTTPLLSRSGNLLGMISTHWSAPHEPSGRDLRLLDILARQAADLLERTIADEALRRREQELERICAALRESEDLQKMLTGELSHRVKNMLATVQAIATQTLRHSAKPEDFVESFGGRIQSMSRVHAQLSTNEWRGTELRDIVRDQMKLGPVDETQILASGPPVHLDAAEVPKMAMILHELGTNSLKYGALSRREGAVTIAWYVSGQKLNLRWVESGGPRVEGLIRSGFGTRLIKASVPRSSGEARMSTEPEGVRWEIIFPLALAAEVESNQPDTDQPTPTSARVGLAAIDGGRSLEGKRILVVEDEPLLAMDVAEQLADAGAHVLGPAASSSEAIELIEQYRLHGALLDANLHGEAVDDVAASLTIAGVPFVFVSGYGRDSLPVAYNQIELISKPFHARQLLDVIQKIAL